MLTRFHNQHSWIKQQLDQHAHRSHVGEQNFWWSRAFIESEWNLNCHLYPNQSFQMSLIPLQLVRPLSTCPNPICSSVAAVRAKPNPKLAPVINTVFPLWSGTACRSSLSKPVVACQQNASDCESTSKYDTVPYAHWIPASNNMFGDGLNSGEAKLNMYSLVAIKKQSIYINLQNIEM